MLKAVMPWILRYLEITPTWKKFIDLIIILLLSGGLASSYVLAMHFDYLLEKINGSLRSNKDIRNNVEVATAVRAVLREIQISLNTSRAYVFQFHDGITSFGGAPFLFQSEVVEVIAPGVSSEISNNQRIPLSINMDMVNRMLTNNCYQYQTNPIDTSPLGQLLLGRGVKIMFACPIYNSRGFLLGFMGISYTGEFTQKPEEVIKKLQESVQKIESLF